MNNLLLFSLYYSSTDAISSILGVIFLILIGFFCCNSLNDDNSQSSKSTYSPRTYSNNSYDYNSQSSKSTYSPRTYSNTSYNEEELNYNWDDSWDDKWLHQGEYADVVDTHSEEYTDYDPSWDEHFRD